MLNKKNVLHYLRCIDQRTYPLYLADANPDVRAAGQAWYTMKEKEASIQISQLTVKQTYYYNILCRDIAKATILVDSIFRDGKYRVDSILLAKGLSSMFNYKFNPWSIAIPGAYGYLMDHICVTTKLGTHSARVKINNKEIYFKFKIVGAINEQI